MSAAVMDNGSYLKRPWDQGGNFTPRPQYAHTEHRASLPGISTGLSYPGSPPERSHSAHQRLPSISAAIERPVQSPREASHTSTSRAEDPSRLPPRKGNSPHQGSTKRRRLSYELEPDTNSTKLGRESNIPRDDGYRNHHGHMWSLPPQHENSLAHGDHTCLNLEHTKHLVQDVLSGLANLEAELRNALSGQLPKTLKQEESNVTQAPDATKIGLRPSLQWAAQHIASSTRLISELAINRAFPPIINDRPQRESPQPPSSSGAQGLAEGLAWRPEPVDETYENNHFRPHQTNTPPSTQDDPSTARSASDPPSAHMLRMADYPRKPQPPPHHQYTQQGQPQPSLRSHSPHRSLSNTSGGPHVFTPPQGPNPSAARVLPSPTSTILPSLPSPNLSHQSIPVAGAAPLTLPTLRATDPATAAHLADLQHSISKKTLAYTTLQREHDSLLNAFARQRTRCETLDKKSQVSDTEINTLSEEKVRLQSLVDGLEAQVEELQRAKEEAHRQSVDNGRQYMQILSMSSKLQEQGVTEGRRMKAERDAWARERDELRDTIRGLEIEVARGGNASVAGDRLGNVKAEERLSTGDGDEAATTANVAASSAEEQQSMVEEGERGAEALRAEILRLRSRCRGLEERLEAFRTEVGRLEHVVREVDCIRGALIERLGAVGGAAAGAAVGATTGGAAGGEEQTGPPRPRAE
ncbi:MAG: hypothetical protein Q9160_008573 [Pyrenula sp. 1 TL-2023]